GRGGPSEAGQLLQEGGAASIRPRLRAVEDHAAAGARAAERGERLQFGHGSGPWRTAAPARTGCWDSAGFASIRPRLRAVEDRTAGWRWSGTTVCFNSATAQGRGGPFRLSRTSQRDAVLQFGHGSGPW